MENEKATERLCFSFLGKRVFLIILLEMVLNSSFHRERVASCSAVGRDDKLKERSLAFYEMCMAKRWWRHGKKSTNRGHFFAVRAANFCTITEHEGIHRGSQ